MIFRKTKALTLIELIIVVIIVGILASIAIPSYFRSVAISRAREAKSALGLIQAGQKIYYSRTKSYLNDGNIANINSQLGLSLEESYWDYFATSNSPQAGDVGVAVHGSYVYKINIDGTITCLTTCPE